jgi:tetratricopeptide (TPR) repeat protein
MSLRPKTLRRLAIILTVIAVLVGVGLGLYWRNNHVRKARLAADRTAGVRAFQSKDYATAITRLRPYISKVQSDADALYAYGASRFRFEESEEHSREARSLLMMVLQLNPEHIPAQRELLDLYTASSAYNTETVELADKLLRRDPNDVAALRAKSIALDRSHNFKEAFALSDRLNQLEPENIDQHLRSYDLLRKLGQTPEQLLERARQQQNAHPGDPRFEMILAMAYGYANDFERGKAMLTQASTRPAPDANFVRQMVRLFDSIKMYDQAQLILERGSKDKDPVVRRLLIQRLWQNRKTDEVLKRLADVDPASPAADASLLAYKALALFETNRADEAGAIVSKLSRKDDAQALAWSAALSAHFAPAPVNPRKMVMQLQGAVSRAPDNAVARHFLGEAYAQLGEFELAITSWRRATELSPSWAAPHSKIALALAAGGRYADAVAEAKQATQCAPGQLFPIATWAAVKFAQLEQNPDPAAGKELFETLEKIQKFVPGESQSLPAYVAMLNRAGQREKAIEALQSVLQDPRKYDQSSLLRLAGVSQKEKLGLENELLTAAGSEGDTPRGVLARATELAIAGKPGEGMTLLESKAKRATTQPIHWQLALCQYREAIKHPDAGKSWVALGNSYPVDLDVQTTILRSANSIRSDRAFIGTTIDRLREATGPDGLMWKIERARWLIASDARDKDSAEAVNTLNDVVRASPSLPEPHLLLAEAYENVGNLPAASKELQIAAELQPTPAVALNAARLFHLEGRFADARTYIDKALAAKDIAPALREQAAVLLAQQGENDGAIKILQPMSDPSQAGQLLLAELYCRVNRVADAEATYQKLLSRTPLSIATVQSAVGFYGAQKKVDQAKKVLSRLDELKLSPGWADLARAAYEERYGSAAEAARLYDSAVAVAPSDPEVWRAVIASQLRAGRYALAQASAEKSLKALPGNNVLKSLSNVAGALASSNEAVIDLRTLASAFAAAPDHPAVQQLIAAVADAQNRKLSPEDALIAARKVVDQYPRLAEFQLAVVQWNVKLHRLDDAAKLVSRAVEQFPASADAPRIAANVYRLMRKWDLAAASAQQWRERTLNDPMEAEIFLADAKLHLKDPAGALKLLEPHLQNASSDPAHKIDLVSTAARAYVAANRPGDAQKLLEPLLADRAGRFAWLSIAATDLPTADLALPWIERAATVIPADSRIEQFTLASAWHNAGRRFQSRLMYDRAVGILDTLIAQPDVSADALALRGLVAEQSDDAKSAEAYYRRSLQLNPNQPLPLNNLAYLILVRGGDLVEAKNLTSQAIALSPDTAEFHDTLARIHSTAGNLPAATDAFQRALKLDPDNVQALIGLASTYTATGKKEPAAQLLIQIDRLLKSNKTLSPRLHQELDSLRATIRASAQ